MNSISLVGNLTANPELRQTQSGVPVCTFRLAVQRRYAEKDGTRKADFIACVAWRNTAEFIARHFIKGNRIGVTGSVQTREYDDKNGNRQHVTEVVVDSAEFVAPRTDSQSAPQAVPEPQPGQFQEVEDEQLPF